MEIKREKRTERKKEMKSFLLSFSLNSSFDSIRFFFSSSTSHLSSSFTYAMPFRDTTNETNNCQKKRTQTHACPFSCPSLDSLLLISYLIGLKCHTWRLRQSCTQLLMFVDTFSDKYIYIYTWKLMMSHSIYHDSCLTNDSFSLWIETISKVSISSQRIC